MTSVVKICLPILGPLLPETEQHALHSECIAELCELKKIVPIGLNFGGEAIKLEMRPHPDDEPLVKGRWSPGFRWREYSLLSLHIDATACIENIRQSADWAPGKFTEIEKENICQQHAVTCLELEVHYLLLAANIARPGSLSVVEGYAFVDGQYSAATKPFFAEEFFHAVIASSEKGWPKLLFPSVRDSWEWLGKSGVLVDGVGVGRLGRALSALSHLTTSTMQSSSSIDLLWILLGLESLYSRGNAGLKEQLLAKTEVILGPRTENKKVFGAVYDFRSRLVHGDVDIPFRFSEFDAAERYEKYYAELDEHEAVALATLIATFQWMIRHDEHELKFEYAVRRHETGEKGVDN